MILHIISFICICQFTFSLQKKKKVFAQNLLVCLNNNGNVLVFSTDLNKHRYKMFKLLLQ